MPFTIPSAGKVAGSSTGLTTDLNNLYTAAGSLATFNVLNSTYAGGADPTGVADSGPAFQSAINAAVAAGSGRVYIPAGTYKCATAVSKDFATTCVRITGDGKAATKINWTGTGTCLTLFDSTTASTPFASRRNGSALTGITFDGTSAGASSTLVQIGDFFQFDIDVAVSGGTGGTTNCAGVRFLSQTLWTEQLGGRVYAQNCNPHVVFDVASAGTTAQGSYGRGLLDIIINQVNGANDGVVFQNGAYLYDGRLGIYGNFVTSAGALTSAVLRITGTAPAGHPASTSSVSTSALNIGVECNGAGAFTPQTIVFGASGNINNCTGVMNFGTGSAQFTASNAFGQFQYQGLIVGDTALQSTLYTGGAAQAISGNGQTVLTRLGSITFANPGASSFTGMILQAGQHHGQQFTVVNKGTGSLTWAAAGTSNVATGVSPVLATLTSRVFVWDSVAALWY